MLCAFLYSLQWINSKRYTQHNILQRTKKEVCINHYRYSYICWIISVSLVWVRIPLGVHVKRKSLHAEDQWVSSLVSGCTHKDHRSVPCRWLNIFLRRNLHFCQQNVSEAAYKGPLHPFHLGVPGLSISGNAWKSSTWTVTFIKG